ncbi:MAG TPA: hypothetical protein PLI95_23915 [Polyangiaceae bacterium]|nr:hypothetical protein [Polyangiaceae bacterium]
MDTQSLVPYARFSPATSSLIVFVFGGLVFGIVLTLAITLWSWHRQRAKAARDSVRSDRFLAPGPNVLGGVVEPLDSSPFAVRFRITQSGVERQNKGAWHTTWTEDERTIEAHPFHLRLANGQHIRVEPGHDVFLVDALDQHERTSHATRTLTAELSRGERATVSGVLVREDTPGATPSGYRSSSSRSFVLRPPSLEPMLISAEPLEQRYLRRASVHGRMAIITAVVWIAFHLVAFGRYDLLSWFGEVVQATVVGTPTWTRSTKHGPVTHYGVVARYETADGRVRFLSDEVNASAWGRFSDKPGQTVRFRVVDFRNLACIGTRPTVSDVATAIGVAVNLALIIGYFVYSRTTRPWYDRKKLVQLERGRL